MDVVTAVITAKGECEMTTSITENEQTNQATAATAEKPEPPKKARPTARKTRVAPSKAKSGKKATGAKKGAKGGRKGASTRQGSKTAQVLSMLQRPGGATLKELMKLTSWQAHSIRGFLSGTLGKKMNLTVTSVKGKDGERSYSLEA
jgi:hypothetical protein